MAGVRATWPSSVILLAPGANRVCVGGHNMPSEGELLLRGCVQCVSRAHRGRRATPAHPPGRTATRPSAPLPASAPTGCTLPGLQHTPLLVSEHAAIGHLDVLPWRHRLGPPCPVVVCLVGVFPMRRRGGSGVRLEACQVQKAGISSAMASPQSSSTTCTVASPLDSAVGAAANV